MAKRVEESVTRLADYKKKLLQRFKYKKGYKACLMIMGCQRSGTTFLSNVFSKISYCRVFGEFSVLSNQDKGKIRLNPIPDVLSVMNNCHAPLIVTKPLVESHRASELLSQIPRSRVLWMYRHYKDVALSDVKKFSKGAGKANILPIVNNQHDNWRNENTTKETRYLVKNLFSESLAPVEYACLFWFARNQLYFDQQLEHNKNSTLWSYENFIQHNITMLNQLLNELNQPQQNKKIVSLTYSNSIAQAKNVGIDSDIEKLCESLYSKLQANETLQYSSSIHAT